MHKLKVKLKQHTPLIHFQHDQEGATLRASEVKPKLDRFILKKLGNGQLEEGKRVAKEQGWIIKGQDEALNYKMSIQVGDEKEPAEYMIVSYMRGDDINRLRNNGITVLSNTPYFAQEDKSRGIINDFRKWDHIEKKGLLHDEILLNIISWDYELTMYISNLIQAFFLINNFGTRQSKGFGGFETTSCLLDGNNVILQNNEDLLCENFLFVYKKTIFNSDLQKIFKQINDDYKLLKSGQTRPYAKSKLMLFGLNNHIRWDKRFLKKNINDKYETREDNEFMRYYLKGRLSDKTIQNNNNDEYRYLRALLGLAEQYEFLLDNPAVITGKNKMIVKVKSRSDIQRFQSPILFKVMNNIVYLVGNDVSESMLNKEFSFFVTIQGDNNHINGEVERTLFTPIEFSLKEFVRYAMNRSNDASLNYTLVNKQNKL